MYGFESACQLFEFARRVSSNSETCFSSFSMDNIFSDDLLIFHHQTLSYLDWNQLLQISSATISKS